MNQRYWLTLAIAILLPICAAYPQALPLAIPDGQRPFLVPLAGKRQQLGQQPAPALVKEFLGLGDGDEVVPLGPPSTDAGRTVQSFQQYHQGIKVEHGVYRLHAKGGVPDLITGELYRIPAGLSLRPALSAEQALGRALAYVGAEVYQWQASGGNPPAGELVLCGISRRDRVRAMGSEMALAYKFDVYAARPLSRAYVYVDAHTGTVIHEDAILKHVDGTAHTRYSGSRTIATSAVNGSYRLRDASRGQGVEVYNLRGGTSPELAIDFTDNDNQWTAAEHDNAQMDNAALDAYWGATLTYDYFRNVHGRNSIDGNGSKIACYVHFGSGVVNAFWNGTSVFLGDGGYYNGEQVEPLTTLDITAHEIGHGFCQHTAGLVYRYESGALNEGFSDIWGAAVENYANANKALWTMGEDANFTIRSFSNPNEFGQPDTYLGDHWYAGEGDNGGVHYNSGVLNHWFYLLSVGKTGVNDKGESYSVTGIGIEKAARIAFRTESVYLTANSQYRDACTFSMQAAADLYGANSPEVAQTANAWRAVGVYQHAFTPSGLVATAVSGTQVNLSWRDNSTGESGFQVERSERPAEGFALVGTAGANATTFQDRGVPTDNTYYYRVRSITGTNTYSGYSNVDTATVGAPPIIMDYTSRSTCQAVFLDPGGAGDYGNYQYRVMMLSPATPGSQLRITFTAFDTESGNDYLRIYDGSDTYAPLIGTYSGNTLPPVITATNAQGRLTFQFNSDGSYVRAGWRAMVTCVTPPATPTTLTATAASTTQINLAWADNATDEGGFTVERSTTAGSGFALVATLAANVRAYQDRGLTTDTRYYYRVRAFRGDVFSPYSNEASAVVGTPPLIMSSTSVTTCSAVLLDPGGTGDYGNYQYVVMRMNPETTGSRLQLTFTAFDTESGNDYLRIYDGSDTYAPLIGTYSGNTLPPVVTATNAAGQLTLLFSSDYTTARAGWRATVSCITPPTAPTALTAAAASATEIRLQWTDNDASETGFAVERSLTAGAGFTQVATVSANVTTYADRNLATNTRYYYRVRAYRAQVYSTYSNEAEAALGNAPFIMANTSVTVCNTALLDPGGTGPYSNSQNVTMVLTPTTAGRKLSMTFSAFSLDYGDYLYVYDGASSSAPLLGNYTGNTLPARVTASNAAGQLTLRFYADSYGTAAGFQAALSCVDVPNAPSNLAATATSATQINLTWTDNATGESGYYLERSVSPNNGFTQIAALGANVTSYANPNLPTNNYYYYRIRAYTGDFTSPYSNVASAAVGNAPILMRNGSVTTCNAVFRDSGGGDNYSNSENFTLTLSPADATQRLRVTFSAFGTESCCDYLRVYDGASTSAPLIGTYQGSTVPPVINATNAEGKLTFWFYSDGSVAGSGWEATVACVSRPVPVVTNFTPASGPVGTLLTINGAYLSDATAVKFSGNASAVFTRLSDSQITATVPAGAVSGPIQVITPFGTATSTAPFTVTKLNASVALGNLTFTYDGSPKRATVATTPVGLDVRVTYNGSATPPVNAGSYEVVAVVESNTHQGQATGTLVIRQAPATVQVGKLLQTYDRAPKTVTVTTTPAGLPVTVTYAGPTQSPQNAGSYPFTATITGGNYSGSTQGVLVIEKATQTVDLAALPDLTFGGAPLQFIPTASSDLPVQILLWGPASLTGNTIVPTGPGQVKVNVRQDGNENYYPAVPVERTFCVLPPKPVVITGNSATEILLTSSSAEGNQWLFNGQPIEGATGATYRVNQAGNFSVRVRINGCESVSEMVVLTAGEEHSGGNGGLRAFPNPTSGKVRLTCTPSQRVKSLTVIVYNSLGWRVGEAALERTGEAWNTTVQLREYAAGLYFFSLVDDQNHVVGTLKVFRQ